MDKIKRDSSAILALAALQANDIDHAVKVAHDWHISAGHSDDPFFPLIYSDDVRLCFIVTPSIMKDISAESMTALRYAVALACLGFGSDWFTEDSGTVCGLTPKAAMQTMISRVQSERNMRDWINSGVVTHIKIFGSKDGSCESCSRLFGEEIPIAIAPEMPNPECVNSNIGCRCAAAATRFSAD